MHAIRTLLIAALWLNSSVAVGQQKSLSLDGYSKNAVLVISGSKALAIVGGDTSLFNAVQHKGIVRLSMKDSVSATLVLALSEKNAQSIIAQYEQKYGKIGAINLLYNRAQELGGTMFLVEDQHSVSVRNDTAAQAQLTQNIDDALPDAGLAKSQSFLDTLPKWLWIPFAAIVALLSALLLRVSKRKPHAVTPPTVTETNIQSSEIVRLQVVIDELNNAIATDKLYSKALQDTIVTPARQALTSGDVQRAAQYCVKALYHLAAITNAHLQTRSTSDIYNINSMTGNATPQQLKTISRNTPADEVPKEIKTLIQLLNQFDAADLGDTAILDCKIMSKAAI